MLFQRNIAFLAIIVGIFGSLLTPVFSIDFASATSDECGGDTGGGGDNGCGDNGEGGDGGDEPGPEPGLVPGPDYSESSVNPLLASNLNSVWSVEGSNGSKITAPLS